MTRYEDILGNVTKYKFFIYHPNSKPTKINKLKSILTNRLFLHFDGQYKCAINKCNWIICAISDRIRVNPKVATE